MKKTTSEGFSFAETGKILLQEGRLPPPEELERITKNDLKWLAKYETERKWNVTQTRGREETYIFCRACLGLGWTTRGEACKRCAGERVELVLQVEAAVLSIRGRKAGICETRCKVCGGLGRVIGEGPCLQCNGTGGIRWVRIP